MGGMMPEEPPEVPDDIVQVSPDLRPPDAGMNGGASAAPAFSLASSACSLRRFSYQSFRLGSSTRICLAPPLLRARAS